MCNAYSDEGKRGKKLRLSIVHFLDAQGWEGKRRGRKGWDTARKGEKKEKKRSRDSSQRVVLAGGGGGGEREYNW